MRRRLAFSLAVTGLVSLALTGCAAAPEEPVDEERRTFAQPGPVPREADTVEPMPSPTPQEPESVVEGAMNILILGSDARPEGSDVAGARSDVVMLAHIDAEAEGITVFSFPRDLYVDVPGHGDRKINAALALGGMNLAADTMAQYADIPIDHTVLVDFTGLEEIVDSLGGITVNVPTPFTHKDTGKRFEGEMRLNGAEALTLSRERYALPGGDFDRNKSQLAVLEGIKNEITSAGVLVNPIKLGGFLKTMGEYVQTDDALTATRLLGLAWDVKGAVDNVRFAQAPHGQPEMVNGQSIVTTDEAGMGELREALRTDDLSEYFAARN